MLYKQLEIEANKDTEEKSLEDYKNISEKCDTIISKIKKKNKNNGDNNG